MNQDSATVPTAEQGPDGLDGAVVILGERQLDPDGGEAGQGGDQHDGQDDAASLVLRRNAGLDVGTLLAAHLPNIRMMNHRQVRFQDRIVRVLQRSSGATKLRITNRSRPAAMPLVRRGRQANGPSAVRSSGDGW